ncbi:hypothetical protein BU25DRAFT_425289 [Macroventuria anomochaeta]|uniref:Uncharacterized protein n=1 Tax=Macroventuria anomochaeta TaxID=301207 RepID=A0ACB6RMS2_9PLEO|nr:uncharacterized protein BU25DRAFT_425289 [Macroventuria anomochaeta]KAF2623038.1 hypothetical protein BU25DRAFT_425289 [Macroventuria anomochaeta]
MRRSLLTTATMNDEHFSKAEAQMHMRHSGPALVTTVWLLSSMLIPSVFVRLLHDFRQRSRRRSPAIDDVLVLVVALFALASMFTMSTTVTSTATQENALNTVHTSDSQVRTYVSTVLFVLGLSLSRMPLIFWLKRLELHRVYRTCTIAIGCAILACTIVSTTSVMFQCKLPRPWDIRMGRCIHLIQQPFWTTIIAIDITLDMTLIVLPVFAVMGLGVQQHNEGWAAFILSLRTLLIIPSLVRLVYLQQPTPTGYNPALESLPYAIATQCQIAIAAILSCSPALPCLTTLVDCPSTITPVTVNEHWSASSSCSNLANDYFASAPITLVKEPLPAIQASMTTPTSSQHGSVVSLTSPLGGTFAKPPPRPAPPSEHQRPDMSMFTRRPTVMRPPLVTLLRNGCDDRPCNMIFKQDWHVGEAVGTSKHVKFNV